MSATTTCSAGLLRALLGWMPRPLRGRTAALQELELVRSYCAHPPFLYLLLHREMDETDK